MRLNVPTAAVLVVLIVATAAVLLAGPADTRTEVLAGLASIGGLVLAVLRPLLTRDEDHDGIPDVLDRGDDDA